MRGWTRFHPPGQPPRRRLRGSSRPAVFLRTAPLTALDARIEALAASTGGKPAIERLHALREAVRDAVDVALIRGATSGRGARGLRQALT
jgi:hypothetical protein